MVDFRPIENEDRPCYIEFELQAEEDRDATIAQGMPVFRDVEIAHLTPPGNQGTLVLQKRITPAPRRQGPEAPGAVLYSGVRGVEVRTRHPGKWPGHQELARRDSSAVADMSGGGG